MDMDEFDILAGNPQEIVGALQEIVGAMNVGDFQGAARALQRARAIDPSAAMVRTKQLQSRRQQLLGIAATAATAAGATTQITVNATDLFRPEQLKVHDTVADAFVITSIKVGSKEQILNSDGVPCSAFKSNAFGVDLLLETINPGVPTVLTVTNISGAAATFRGNFVGTASH